jgi:hypothetical protein
MKIVGYSLLESDNYEEFVTEVARLCTEEGWFPSGGVCIWFEPPGPRQPDDPANPIKGTTHYAQALVQYGQ